MLVNLNSIVNTVMVYYSRHLCQMKASARWEAERELLKKPQQKNELQLNYYALAVMEVGGPLGDL